MSAGEWNVQNFVVVLRRDATPMNCGNDGAVRERERPFLKGLDRYVVADLSAQLLAHTREMELFHGDQLPVAVSGRDFDSVYRGDLFISGSSRTGGEGDNTSHGCNCNHQEGNPFHKFPPFGIADESKPEERPMGGLPFGVCRENEIL